MNLHAYEIYKILEVALMAKNYYAPWTSAALGVLKTFFKHLQLRISCCYIEPENNVALMAHSSC